MKEENKDFKKNIIIGLLIAILIVGIIIAIVSINGKNKELVLKCQKMNQIMKIHHHQYRLKNQEQINYVKLVE